MAQYKYAKNWEQKEKPHEAFYWMSQSANGLYPKAMRDVAIYYAKGYGVKPSMENAIKWILKYATISPRESDEVLEMAKSIFDKSEEGEGMRVLKFLKELLIIEHGQHFSSTTQRAIADEMTREMGILGEYWLSRGNLQEAQGTVAFCIDIASTYEDVFDNVLYVKAEEIMSQVREARLSK